ncbi:MAG: hypothetical protein K2H65_01750, partial [Bacteroidales bacterium]|nr:hypothetical protein [Bacteroidales bacterium]
MAKKLLIASLLLFLGWSAQAQDDVSSVTYPGQGDSKAVVMTGLQDGIITFISEDKLMSGSTGDFGFVYNPTDGKTTLYNDFLLQAFISPDHYVASPKGEGTVPYVYYKGKHELERTIQNNETYNNDLSFWSAQPNGNRVVMLGYEWDYGKNSLDKWDSTTNPVGIVYDGKTGKVITKLHSKWPRVSPLRAEANTNYGSRATAISYDGNVLGGWGTWPLDTIYSTWQTTFWDLVDYDETNKTIYTYAIEDPRFCMSDLTGANRDGSMLVGYNEVTSHGLVIHYDRANKSFTVDTVGPLPGYGLTFFNTIDDNGLVFGFCSVEADPYSRKAAVYDTKTKVLMDLNTYLYEYYDITAPRDLGCPTLATPDGTLVSGFYFQGNIPTPWYIQFGDRIRPRARNVKAKAIGDGYTAHITWQAPLASEHTLTGFEIYRDDNPVAIQTLGKNDLFYDEENCPEGNHTYKVVAVYGDEKAGAATSNLFMIGSIFPVQQIGHNLQYNRYASIYWGIPSSEVVMSAMNKVAAKNGQGIIDRSPVVAASRTAPAAAHQAKTYKNTALDFIYNVDMLMYNGYCGIKIGDLYYISSWQGGGIRIMDQYNTVTEEWEPAGLNEAVLSMVYFPDKNQLYCGSTENIYILDLDNHNRIISTIEGVPSRHLTYLPDLEIKGNKGVLMTGGWEDAKFYTIDGKYLEESGFDFTGLSVSGTAYHDGKVYAASQTGPNSNEIYVFDLATRQQIGDPIQVAEDPAVLNVLNPDADDVATADLSVAGGLTTCTLDDGTVALVAGYQCSWVYSQLMFLELESAPERKGYNLYRDGKLIAQNLTTRRYYEELTPGTYEYTVKAIYTDELSDYSPATTVKINGYGKCLPVKDLYAHETNRWVALEWDVPTSDTAAGLVGFSVFRDGTKIAELWNEAVSLNYNDLSDLKVGTTYTYRLESLYSTGCKADTSVKITVTNEGTAMAPFGLNVTKKRNAAYTADKKLFDLTAEWETPLF